MIQLKGEFIINPATVGMLSTHDLKIVFLLWLLATPTLQGWNSSVAAQTEVPCGLA